VIGSETYSGYHYYRRAAMAWPFVITGILLAHIPGVIGTGAKHLVLFPSSLFCRARTPQAGNRDGAITSLNLASSISLFGLTTTLPDKERGYCRYDSVGQCLGPRHLGDSICLDLGSAALDTSPMSGRLPKAHLERIQNLDPETVN
jgi:hypothetical protein